MVIFWRFASRENRLERKNHFPWASTGTSYSPLNKNTDRISVKSQCHGRHRYLYTRGNTERERERVIVRVKGKNKSKRERSTGEQWRDRGSETRILSLSVCELRVFSVSKRWIGTFYSKRRREWRKKEPCAIETPTPDILCHQNAPVPLPRPLRWFSDHSTNVCMDHCV